MKKLCATILSAILFIAIFATPISNEDSPSSDIASNVLSDNPSSDKTTTQ